MSAHALAEIGWAPTRAPSELISDAHDDERRVLSVPRPHEFLENVAHLRRGVLFREAPRKTDQVRHDRARPLGGEHFPGADDSLHFQRFHRLAPWHAQVKNKDVFLRVMREMLEGAHMN